MNKTVIDGKLKQVRGQAKTWSGQFDKLIGSLQERFGYNRERAKRELKRRMAKHATRGTTR